MTTDPTTDMQGRNDGTTGNPQGNPQGGIAAHLLAFFAGIASGLAFVQLFGGGMLGMMIAYVSPMPVMLAGYTGGRAPAITATIFAILAVFLRVGGPAAVLFAAIIAVPAMVLVRVSLIDKGAAAPRQTSASVMLLTLLTLGTILMLTAASLMKIYGPGISQVLGDMIGAYRDMIAKTQPDMPADVMDRTLVLMRPMIPGLSLLSWLVIMLLNFCLTQFMSREISYRRQPDVNMKALVLPAWLSGLTILFLAIAAWFQPSDISVTLTALVTLYMTAFIISGAAWMHRRIDARAASHNWTPGRRIGFYLVFYLALVVLQLPALFLLLAGLIAPFTDLRLHQRTVVVDTSTTESKE